MTNAAETCDLRTNWLKRRLFRVAVWALLWTAAVSGVARGDPIDSEVRVKPEFYLTGITKRYSQSGDSTNYATVAATLEFTFFSEARPYWGGPFVDFRHSSNGRFDRNFGGYFRYNLSRLDMTAWLFINQSPGDSDTWLYATRFRYRVADGHKLGVETMAPINDADTLDLMLGYYGSISESLTLRFFAGTGVNSGPDRAVKLELAWQVR